MADNQAMYSNYVSPGNITSFLVETVTYIQHLLRETCPVWEKDLPGCHISCKNEYLFSVDLVQEDGGSPLTSQSGIWGLGRERGPAAQVCSPCCFLPLPQAKDCLETRSGAEESAPHLCSRPWSKEITYCRKWQNITTNKLLALFN